MTIDETVDLTICEEEFHITLVPETELAVRLFDNAKHIFIKHGYLQDDEESPESFECFGRVLTGLVLTEDQCIHSCKFTPEEEAGEVAGEVAYGNGCDDDPEVLNELKTMIADSKLINDNFIYINLDDVTGIGFSKECVGFEIGNEDDF